MPSSRRWVPLRSANPKGGKWDWKGELLRFLRKAFKIIRIWADPSLWLLKKILSDRERRNYILLEGWKNSPEYIPITLNWAQKIPKTVINLYHTLVSVCMQNPLFFSSSLSCFPPPQTQKRSCLEMCIPIFSFWEYYQVDMNKLQRIYHLSKMHF